MLILSLVLIVLGVAGDQIIKYLVVENLKPNGVITTIPGFLQFVYVENTGAAFGMFDDFTMILTIITAICIVVVLAAMILYQKHTFFSRAASILIISGGIGNLIDRFLLGYVVDYIQVSFFPPIFNLADCFVVVGVIFFLIHFLFFMERDNGPEKILRGRR